MSLKERNTFYQPTPAVSYVHSLAQRKSFVLPRDHLEIFVRNGTPGTTTIGCVITLSVHKLHLIGTHRKLKSFLLFGLLFYYSYYYYYY